MKIEYKIKYKVEDFELCLSDALTGDVSAVEKVLELLAPLIKASIKKYYFGELDREDLIQEGYTMVATCIKDYDPKKGVYFLGFVKTKLRFLYMDMGRKHIREQCDSLNVPVKNTEGHSELLDILPDLDSSADEPLLKSENLTQLKLALSTLSKREQQVVLLSFVQRKDMYAIAEELGVAYRTIVNTKTNAIKKLRSYF